MVILEDHSKKKERIRLQMAQLVGQYAFKMCMIAFKEHRPLLSADIVHGDLPGVQVKVFVVHDAEIQKKVEEYIQTAFVDNKAAAPKINNDLVIDLKPGGESAP